MRTLSDLTIAKARTPSGTAVADASATVGSALKPKSRPSPVITGKGATTSSGIVSTDSTSLFPVVLDAFSAPAENQQVSATDFSQLKAAVAKINATFTAVAKASPGDLVKRLTGRQVASGSAAGGLRLLGGSKSSAIRSPVSVSVGATITILGNTSSATVDTALSSAQLTALGVTTTWAAAGGIAILTSSKLQVSSGNPLTLLPQALVGRVDCRVDDNGTVRFLLQSGGGFLAPGTWYVYALFVRSAYNWQQV